MVKKNHQEKMKEQYIKDDILGQIARHFMETGKFDPFSAKMPDTSVKFEEIQGKLDDNEVIYRFFPYKYFEQLLDEKKIAFRPAVEISYLSEDNQYVLLAFFQYFYLSLI